MQKWRGPHPKKKKKRKGGKQTKAFTRSAPDGASKVAKYTVLVHALLLGFLLLFLLLLLRHRHRPLHGNSYCAHTSPSYISSSCKPATTNILLALSILSHIVLHSTYFPLYLPYFIVLIYILSFTRASFSPSFLNYLHYFNCCFLKLVTSSHLINYLINY